VKEIPYTLNISLSLRESKERSEGKDKHGVLSELISKFSKNGRYGFNLPEETFCIRITEFGQYLVRVEHTLVTTLSSDGEVPSEYKFDSPLMIINEGIMSNNSSELSICVSIHALKHNRVIPSGSLNNVIEYPKEMKVLNTEVTKNMMVSDRVTITISSVTMYGSRDSKSICILTLGSAVFNLLLSVRLSRDQRASNMRFSGSLLSDKKIDWSGYVTGIQSFPRAVRA